LQSLDLKFWAKTASWCPEWEQYKVCGTCEELDAFRLALKTTLSWYSTSTRSEDSCFVQLAALENEHKPFMERFRYLEDRAAVLDRLSDTLAAHFRRASSCEERDAHIPASETARVSKLCLETQRWLYDANDDASDVTTEAVLARLRELDELAQSVFD
jgi:hypothetical protein